MGLRHNLEQLVVMDETAKMNDNAGIFKGMDRYECRKKLIEILKDQELLINIDDHMHSLDIVNAVLISLNQWFQSNGLLKWNHWQNLL